MKSKTRNILIPILVIIFALAFFLGKNYFIQDKIVYSESVMTVPVYSGEPYVVIHDNQPEFTENDHTLEAYEYYGNLDRLGRCTQAMACIGPELMPTEERESISSVKPSGWVQAQYDIVDGKNLYNRCHLIGFQLTGENANERNLITGTRYMNVEGMLPFENMIADYIKETANHVLYRVTPIYDGSNLVARGVQLEALSMEDDGEGICFNVYVYNHQPGIVIYYADGTSQQDEITIEAEQAGNEYVLNTNSLKFHLSTCAQAENMSPENRQDYSGDRQTLIDQGYVPAGCCKP